MDVYFPSEPGEQLAFLAALGTFLTGCVFLLAPGLLMRAGRSEPAPDRAHMLHLARLCGGLAAGFAGTALLLAQPVIYLALGCALALSAFGQMLALLTRGERSFGHVIVLALQLIGSAFSLLYVFGLM